MLSLSDNADELERALERADRELREGLMGVVAETCDEAAEHARDVAQFTDHTGDLRRSITGRLVRRTPKGASGEIVAKAPYASHVEEGTEPHEIRPKARGGDWKGPVRPGQSRRDAGDVGTHRTMLRWFVGGEARFARVVHHPGSRPYPFMGPAYLKAQALLRAKTERLVAKIVERFKG